jgi:hypothetical protein
VAYQISLGPAARNRLEVFTLAERLYWRHVTGLLRESPFPSTDFDFITAIDDQTYGVVFSYSDDVFPYVVQYRVHPPDPDAGYGLIRIVNFVRVDRAP